MKRYLWTVVAVLFVNANALENPFALKENLLKIDRDQEMLLSELAKIAEAREVARVEVEETELVEKVKEIVPSDNTSVKMKDSEEQYNLTNSIDELVGDDEKKDGVDSTTTSEGSAGDSQKEETVSSAIAAEALKIAIAKEEEAAKKAAFIMAQEKEAQEKADKAKFAQAQAHKEADEKAKLVEEALETERREVLAYEKQRAEKLLKQAEVDTKKKVEAKSVEKIAVTVGSIDVKTEKITAKKIADAGYKDAVKEMGGVENIVTPTPTVETTKMVEEKSAAEEIVVVDGDIDVEAEKIASKEAADIAYLEAIKEMDLED